MLMNRKARSEVTRLVDAVVARSFDHDDISLLLVRLRPFVRSKLLRDLADYVAHPERRDRGVSTSDIELNYRRITRIANAHPPLPITPLTADLFELWLLGVEQTEPACAKEHFLMNQREAAQAIRGAYDRNADLWVLKSTIPLFWRLHLSRMLHAVFDSFKPKALFTQEGVVRELRQAIASLGLPLATQYQSSLSLLQDDVTVCLMSCVQQAEIQLRDKTQASLVWGHLDGGPNLALYAAFEIPFRPPANGTVGIRIHHFTSNAKAADYVEGELEPGGLLTTHRRTDGRLVLLPEDGH